MSAPPQAAEAAAAASSYQRGQARLAAAAAVMAAAAWRGIDGRNLDLSWMAVLARLLPVVSGAQRKAAAAAPAYAGGLLRLQEVAAAGAVRLEADAFAGLTGDGRPMATLLYAPVALAKHRIGGGMRIADALAAEELHLAMLVRTQVQDAGRMGLQSAMAAEPGIRGYVRHVTLPACARCIILAGRFYRYSAAFLRHPNCDCTMVPAVGPEWVESQDPAELIAQMRGQHAAALRRSLTHADLRALDHGADLNQVVNAHRGMATAAGRKVTREGTAKRGLAGKRLGRVQRLTPAQIFDEAARLNWAREEIVRQLTRFGYII